MQLKTSSISNFKIFILSFLLPWLAIVAIFGCVFNYVFERFVIFNTEISGCSKIHRLITETHTDEIGIFGSSRAEGSFLPDSIAPRMYNYGMSGTKFDVTLFCLKQECLKKKTGPLVINLDYDGFVRGYGDVATFVPFADRDDIKTILGAEAKVYYAIPFIKYFGSYETYIRNFLNNKMQLTKLANHGAKLEKNELTLIQFNELVRQRLESPVGERQDSVVVQDFEILIHTNPSRKFLLVVSPLHSSCFYGGKSYPNAYALMNRLKANANVRFYDFSHFDLPEECFLNTTHLNVKGARLFSKVLGDSLRTELNLN